jgi:hypothetical protein
MVDALSHSDDDLAQEETLSSGSGSASGSFTRASRQPLLAVDELAPLDEERRVLQASQQRRLEDSQVLSLDMLEEDFTYEESSTSSSSPHRSSSRNSDCGITSGNRSDSQKSLLSLQWQHSAGGVRPQVLSLDMLEEDFTYEESSTSSSTPDRARGTATAEPHPATDQISRRAF